jgi:hypothetical protein
MPALANLDNIKFILYSTKSVYAFYNVLRLYDGVDFACDQCLWSKHLDVTWNPAQFVKILEVRCCVRGVRARDFAARSNIFSVVYKIRF